ncbi:MAG: rRNA maturation RNase YbeY, partial [Deltaproteobacteria bacterium]
MEILINVQAETDEIHSQELEKKARKILSALGYTEAELSIALVDEQLMAELNEKYRGYSKPTNVLSFSMSEGDFPHLHPEVLGDVVICVPVAKREAEEGSLTLEQRLTELLVHGILHLVGFDHEKSEKDAEKMKKKMEEIMDMLNKNN